MTTAVLDNSVILINPSKELFRYINNMDITDDMPQGIVDVRSKNKMDTSNRRPQNHKLLTTQEDFDYIKSIEGSDDVIARGAKQNLEGHPKDRLLNLEDLHWLRERIMLENARCGEKVYFHEMFQGSEVLVPKNKEITRNPALEERCKRLKAQQDNRRYKAMTKDVDCERRKHPDDTIAYQLKQINTHLIAIAQFIVSVLAGFTFGFLGVELMIGNLDFGFRLLLGIICALVIALAELYFLAKKLNEDLEFETRTPDRATTSKAKID